MKYEVSVLNQFATASKINVGVGLLMNFHNTKSFEFGLLLKPTFSTHNIIIVIFLKYHIPINVGTYNSR